MEPPLAAVEAAFRKGHTSTYSSTYASAYLYRYHSILTTRLTTLTTLQWKRRGGRGLVRAAAAVTFCAQSPRGLDGRPWLPQAQARKRARAGATHAKPKGESRPTAAPFKKPMRAPAVPGGKSGRGRERARESGPAFRSAPPSLPPRAPSFGAAARTRRFSQRSPASSTASRRH